MIMLPFSFETIWEIAGKLTKRTIEKFNHRGFALKEGYSSEVLASCQLKEGDKIAIVDWNGTKRVLQVSVKMVIPTDDEYSFIYIPGKKDRFVGGYFYPDFNLINVIFNGERKEYAEYAEKMRYHIFITIVHELTHACEYKSDKPYPEKPQSKHKYVNRKDEFDCFRNEILADVWLNEGLNNSKVYNYRKDSFTRRHRNKVLKAVWKGNHE